MLFLLCFTGPALATGSPLLLGNTPPTLVVATHNDDVLSRILFDKLGADLPVEFEYAKYPDFSTALSAVEDGRADLMANVVPLDKRKVTLDFSLPTNVQSMYFFKKTLGMNVKQLKKIAVPRRDVTKRVLREFLPGVEIITYSGAKQAIELIENGQVDGVVASVNYLKTLLSENYYTYPVSDFYPVTAVSIAATKGKYNDLLNYFSSRARDEKIKLDYFSALNQYEKQLRIEVLRQRKELAQITITEPLRIKLTNSKLHANHRQDGSVKGVTADTILEACDILEVQCHIVSRGDEQWSEMYQDLLHDNIDMLAPAAKTEERHKLLDFSKPYYLSDAIVIKRKGYKHNAYHHISELFAERIGMLENTSFESIFKKYLPYKNFSYFETNDELIAALLENKVDYVPVSEDFYNNLIMSSDGKLPIAKVSSIGVFKSYDLRVAFSKGEQSEALSKLFSGAINLVNVNNIVDKYRVSVDWQKKTAKQEEWTKVLFLILMSTIVVLTFCFYYWKMKSETDALTSLSNRYCLNKDHGRGIPTGSCLIYFDLDKFKDINDNFSHYVGDKVLKTIASNIDQHWIGKAYRIGGDEFVLVGKISEEELHDKMNLIGSFNYTTKNNELVPVNISYGIYFSNEERLPLDEILKIADSDMYTYKSA